MAKTKFNIITSTCVPLPLENVDTDQIIPARFLKATTREEKFFGDNLFRDWRYNADGSLNKDFVLNNPTYSGQILVAGKNFGSGSSREHAAWAIAGYGFRVVVSSFFENTEAFRWLSAHAVEYGFILRYPKNAEAVTEITYEPWHWRYVGPENAALIQQSGLCFEDAVAVLQKLAAGEKITG